MSLFNFEASFLSVLTLLIMELSSFLRVKRWDSLSLTFLDISYNLSFSLDNKLLLLEISFEIDLISLFKDLVSLSNDLISLSLSLIFLSSPLFLASRDLFAFNIDFFKSLLLISTFFLLICAFYAP